MQPAAQSLTQNALATGCTRHKRKRKKKAKVNDRRFRRAEKEKDLNREKGRDSRAAFRCSRATSLLRDLRARVGRAKDKERLGRTSKRRGSPCLFAIADAFSPFFLSFLSFFSLFFLLNSFSSFLCLIRAAVDLPIQEAGRLEARLARGSSSSSNSSPDRQRRPDRHRPVFLLSAAEE